MFPNADASISCEPDERILRWDAAAEWGRAASERHWLNAAS